VFTFVTSLIAHHKHVGSKPQLLPQQPTGTTARKSRSPPRAFPPLVLSALSHVLQVSPLGKFRGRCRCRVGAGAGGPGSRVPTSHRRYCGRRPSQRAGQRVLPAAAVATRARARVRTPTCHLVGHGPPGEQGAQSRRRTRHKFTPSPGWPGSKNAGGCNPACWKPGTWQPA
jgi:hypothetical protein